MDKWVVLRKEIKDKMREFGSGDDGCFDNNKTWGVLAGLLSKMDSLDTQERKGK